MAAALRLAALFAAAALVALAPRVLSEGQLSLITEIFVVLAIATMWNLLAGYTGLVSLGHQMFFGIGGYAVFLVSNGLDIHPFLALPAGPLAAALAALVVAPLLFRLRDAYFAIASWVLAEIVFILVQHSDAFGGITGMPLFTGALLGPNAYAETAWLAGGIALLLLAGSYLLLRSTFGLGLMCVRDNEAAATAIGVDVWRNRLVAFVISAAGIGAVGPLYLLPNFFIQPGIAFSAEWTVIMTFVTVIGGIGTLEGPVVGTLIYFAIRQLTTSVLHLPGSWYLVVLGFVAILVMLYAPRGVWPVIRDRLGVDWLGIRHFCP